MRGLYARLQPVPNRRYLTVDLRLSHSVENRVDPGKETGSGNAPSPGPCGRPSLNRGILGPLIRLSSHISFQSRGGNTDHAFIARTKSCEEAHDQLSKTAAFGKAPGSGRPPGLCVVSPVGKRGRSPRSDRGDVLRCTAADRIVGAGRQHPRVSRPAPSAPRRERRTRRCTSPHPVSRLTWTRPATRSTGPAPRSRSPARAAERPAGRRSRTAPAGGRPSGTRRSPFSRTRPSSTSRSFATRAFETGAGAWMLRASGRGSKRTAASGSSAFAVSPRSASIRSRSSTLPGETSRRQDSAGRSSTTARAGGSGFGWTTASCLSPTSSIPPPTTRRRSSSGTAPLASPARGIWIRAPARSTS